MNPRPTRNRTSAIAVTVAVVVKDRKDWMARCLEAIDTQEYPSFNILIVDNGSTDGTYEYLTEASRSARHPMTVLQELGPLGHARNFALEHATGSVIAFTDSDCTPQPGWLAAGASRFEPGVGAVQGRTMPMRDVEPWGATIDIPQFSNLYETCNMFFDRAALRSAGGFDTSMPHFGDDVGAGWRVRNAGWETRWAPDAIVEHEVTYPGFTWWMRRCMRYECWPLLVREFPGLRREVLFGHYFLNRRHPIILAAVGGVATSVVRRDPRPLTLALPLLWRWRPRAISRRGLRNTGYGLAFDIVTLSALARASAKTRTLVL